MQKFCKIQCLNYINLGQSTPFMWLMIKLRKIGAKPESKQTQDEIKLRETLGEFPEEVL